MNEKKLYKSREDKYIGGVCGGIGEYFEIDSTIIRLATILLSFATSGVLILIYILLCFLIPYEPITPYNTNEKQSANSSYNQNYQTKKGNNYENPVKENKRQYNLGIFLVIIGVVLFLSKILPEFISRFIVPIGFLIAGILLITSAAPAKKKKDGELNKAEKEDYTKQTANQKANTEPNEETKSEENKDEEVKLIETSDEIIFMGTSEENSEDKNNQDTEDLQGEFTKEELIKMKEEGDDNE